MRIAFLDCFSGVSGDMLLGAFLDIGWPAKKLLKLPRMLGLKDIAIDVCKVKRSGIVGQHVKIVAGQGQPLRTLDVISRVIINAPLPSKVRQGALNTFKRLAEAEARIHGCPVNEVRFHEIGAADTIIDICGAFLAIENLGIEKVFCSPLPMPRGLVTCEHGTIPLPAPAVLELLRGRDIYPVEGDRELVTPTGAAIVTELSERFGQMPPMRISNTGYGAGAMELPSRPNLLRIVEGYSEDVHMLQGDTVVQIMTVIDDMLPETAGFVFDMVFDAGAIDAWIVPVYMKKNRPGFELVLLCREDRRDGLLELLFRETSTTGARILEIQRRFLPRRKIMVNTKWGEIQAKLVVRPGELEDVVPEFRACQEVSRRFGVPIRQVYAEVSRAGAGGKAD